MPKFTWFRFYNDPASKRLVREAQSRCPGSTLAPESCHNREPGSGECHDIPHTCPARVTASSSPHNHTRCQTIWLESHSTPHTIIEISWGDSGWNNNALLQLVYWLGSVVLHEVRSSMGGNQCWSELAIQDLL